MYYWDFIHHNLQWVRVLYKLSSEKKVASNNHADISYKFFISVDNSRKKKVYEQQENEENPLRCPVKLYEFYLSKW